MTQPIPSLVALYRKAPSVPVSVAGTYQVFVIVNTDTAMGYVRTAQAPVAPLVADAKPPIAPIGVVLPVLIAADSAAFRAARRGWDWDAPPEGTGHGLLFLVPQDSSDGHGLWRVTLVGGGDTSGSTPWARISRALARQLAEPEARTEACRTGIERLNKAARKAHQPAPCDEASGLPLFRADLASDGRLVGSKDGQVSISQKTDIWAGEVVLWGKRVNRKVIPAPNPH
jgi:hypothetical protein